MSPKTIAIIAYATIYAAGVVIALSREREMQRATADDPDVKEAREAAVAARAEAVRVEREARELQKLARAARVEAARSDREIRQAMLRCARLQAEARAAGRSLDTDFEDDIILN